MKINKIILLLFVLFIINSSFKLVYSYQNVIREPALVEEVIVEPTLEEIINTVPLEYGVNPKIISDLAFCESSHRLSVYGDGGSAYGVMQFHKPTFYEYSKKLGQNLNYYSNYDQIKLASYMISQGKSYHWTCSYTIGLL